MNEDFLHYIWQFQLFNSQELYTTDGEKIKLLKAGIINKDAGPDFFNAQLKIGDTLWAGNVEIHIKSSDWFNHHHQKDRLYDKIILHVVWENDKEIKRENGNPIPTIELKGKVNKVLLERYQTLKENRNWIPCEKEIQKVKQFTKLQQIERMLVERLEQKANNLKQKLALNINDWEEAFYQAICKYLGLKVNNIPFELLANALPFSILRKHQSNLLQLEALLLGQAGLLEKSFRGSYPLKLQKEYQFLKTKYKLKHIEPSIWKFMRMRPSNFPTIRLSQLAAIIHQNTSFFEKLRSAKSTTQIYQLFDVTASEYWDSHYQLDIPSSKRRKKRLGKVTQDILLINAAILLLFIYYQKQDNIEGKQLALQLLEKIPGEQNNITKKWATLGMPLESAFHSQALLQLKKEYCDHKRCLDCKIGNEILRRN